MAKEKLEKLGDPGFGDKLEVLRGHCDDEGRDHREITRTVVAMTSPLDDRDGFLAQCQAWADLGVTEVQVTPDRHPVEFAERMAEEVVPAAADIG